MSGGELRVAGMLALAVLFAGPAMRAEAQKGKAMEELLRPYLNAEYVPADGPDTDKEFIRQAAAAIKAALPEKLGISPAGKVKVLVLTQGTYGVLHVPGAGGMLILLREAAAKYDALELTELYSDESITAEMLRSFDAVVLNNTGRAYRHEVFGKLLPDYVRGGGGLLAIHSATLMYMKKPGNEYNKLLGAYVDIVNAQYGHPAKKGKAFTLSLPRPNHPLVAAFRGEGKEMQVTHRWLAGKTRRSYKVTINPPKTLADELYVLIRTPGQETEPEVLASVDPSSSQGYPDVSEDFARAVIWTKRYGKGRVYYSQLGHNMGVFGVPCVGRSLLDGLMWVAGGAQEGGGGGSKR
jgi:type 1 glutamine amidotransferase